jgi:hypothetical protein
VAFVLAEDAVTGECAQQAVERRSVGIGDGCELFGGFGAVGEVVGEAQLGSCPKQKGDGEAHRHLHQLDLWWWRLSGFCC